MTISCDNMSVVEMMNKAASPCKICMVLIHFITFTSIKHNVRFFARHMKTSENTLADALSRLQFKRFGNTLR